MNAISENRRIISDVLGRAPDMELNSIGDGWTLCRWRQFVGSYALPPLPDPNFIVHIAGKPQVRRGTGMAGAIAAPFPAAPPSRPPGGRPDGWSMVSWTW